MTTTYYTFRTQRVKVSGGADLLTLVPVAQHAPAEGRRKAEIIDFDVCRKHAETRQAWDTLSQTARKSKLTEEIRATEEPETPSQPARPSGTERMELIASAAVIVTALSAAAAFLSVL